MAYEMRRRNQQIPEQEAWAMLRANKTCVLSLIDANGNPYGVPMSYTVVGKDVIFHGALSGRRMDAIESGSQGSICVVTMDEIDPENFLTNYMSVIAEGKLSVLEENEERRAALMALARSVNPDEDACEKEVSSFFGECAVMVLHVDSISAKESRLLAKIRREREDAGRTS